MRSEPEPRPLPDFERIVPRRATSGAAATSAPAPAAGAARHVPAGVFVGGLALLLVLGAAAIWLLPRLVPAPGSAPVKNAPAPTAATAEPLAPPPAPPAQATWDDPAQLEARAAAQDARTRFEQHGAELRKHGVEHWGAEALAGAQAQAASGQAAFAAKDFIGARSGYESAAAGAATLLAEVSRRLGAALDAGGQALEAGDRIAAQSAFELALALDPGNAAATRGLARVASFDALRGKIETATRLEQAGDLAGARAALREALALDADSATARDSLARLDAQAADAEFRRALAEAIGALDQNRLDLAEARLARARSLRGGDPAVQQLASRLADARRAQRIAILRSESAAQVSAEDWAGAIRNLRAALELDTSLAFARDGLAQAEPRAALVANLQKLIDRPDRLSSPAVAAEAQQVLAQARAIGDAGPRLRAQIDGVQRALDLAAQPVAVQLRSDGQTEVTIHKLGALGRFTAQSVSLKPGSYVAIGTRAGYRDVRREFVVAPGAAGASVDVRCEESL